MKSHIEIDSITDPVLLLRDLIHERTGLFFRDGDGVEVVASRLSARLEASGYKSFADYYQLLSNGGLTSADEWLQVVAALSKGTTSFFRHLNRVQALVDVVMPQLVLEGFTQPLRIWSAACSTGEEPLTIALALSEAGWFDRMQIEIHASDANFVAIEKARCGVYSRLAGLSSDLLSKYFTPVSDGWQVKPELHKRVSWSVTNLMNESEIAELANSHIIFCRNVFIYFTASTTCETLTRFGELMPPGGFLFTDGGDYFMSLMSQVPYFEQQSISRASVWKKRSAPR